MTFNKEVKPGKNECWRSRFKISKEYGVWSKSKAQAKLEKIPIWLDKFYQGCCNGIRSKGDEFTEPINSDNLKKYYLLKIKNINKSPLAKKPEKAGHAKIRTFPLSRKPKKGWQAKIRENKKKEDPAD